MSKNLDEQIWEMERRAEKVGGYDDERRDMARDCANDAAELEKAAARLERVRAVATEPGASDGVRVAAILSVLADPYDVASDDDRVTLMIHLHPDEHEEIALAAQAAGRGDNAQAEMLLRNALQGTPGRLLARAKGEG